MTLNNTYLIQNKPIKELLDNLDKFTTNITKFKSKHKGYDYKIEITNNDEDKDFFDAEINITYEKQDSIKEVSRTS